MKFIIGNSIVYGGRACKIVGVTLTHLILVDQGDENQESFQVLKSEFCRC